MRSINWHADAWEEYTQLQLDKAVLKKVNRLIREIQVNIVQCGGHYNDK